MGIHLGFVAAILMAAMPTIPPAQSPMPKFSAKQAKNTPKAKVGFGYRAGPKYGSKAEVLDNGIVWVRGALHIGSPGGRDVVYTTHLFIFGEDRRLVYREELGSLPVAAGESDKFLEYERMFALPPGRYQVRVASCDTPPQHFWTDPSQEPVGAGHAHWLDIPK
jgi:hypothetical protein